MTDETAIGADAIIAFYREHVAEGVTRQKDKEKFLRLWSEEYSLVRAADQARISVRLIQRYSNPDDSLYDEAFTEAMQEVRVRLGFEVEDKAVKAAIEKENPAMQRFIMPTLPDPIGGRYSKQSGMVRANVVLFDSDGLAEAIRLLQGKPEMKELPS